MEIKRYTFAHAYSDMLYNLLHNPEYVTSPRGQKINETLNVKITIINPYSNLFENKIRSVPLKYLANELILYFSGVNDIENFGKASPFWKQIANDDGTVNSAYGKLIFKPNKGDKVLTQWEWAKMSLIKDEDSRQAVMHFNRPHHQFPGVKDFPCTMDAQFFIRNNKLHLTVHMRSNDIFFGVTFDFPFFMLLMQAMHMELRSTYPKLKLGNYTHFAGSLHAYERDFETLHKMGDESFMPAKTPIILKNPVLNTDIIDIKNNKKYEGTDQFIKWLDLINRDSLHG